MSIIDSIFRKAAPTSVAADTSAIEASAWTVEVLTSLRDEYRTLASPFTDNPVVRAAIEAMRRNASKAVLQVGYYDDDGGFEPIDHPLSEIWRSPSPGETDQTLIEHLYASILEGGNGYANMVGDVAMDFGQTDGRIVEIQPVPLAWVQLPTLGQSIGEVVSYPVRGWDYNRQYDFVVPSERMLHVKTGRNTSGSSGASVVSMAFGRSVLEAVVPELALIKLVAMYETTILSRSGVPSWIIGLLGPAAGTLSRDQIGVLQQDIQRATSGKASGRPFVHKGEMSINTPGFSPKDLSVAELTEIAVARVCGVLGWAPMTLKQPDTGKTYSNLVEANKASWRDAVIPFLETVSNSLTQAVRALPFGYDGIVAAPDKRLAVRFDVSGIEELAEDQAKLADKAVKLFQAGIMSLDEARTVIGLAEMESDESEPKDDAKDTQQNESEDDGTNDS